MRLLPSIATASPSSICGAARPTARAGGRWEEDSLQLIFSGTKGLVATCVLVLLDRGVLALDDPVAKHWPEFAAAGKEDVRVRDLVAHTARLPALEQQVTVDEILDDRRMAALLAAQPQSDDPRAAGCYHALTFGWLVGELIRRADGRSVGRFFADEVAAPLELELWIGLPDRHASRVTTIEPSPAPAVEDTDPLSRQIWANPPIWEPDVFGFNRPDLHACEMPAVNGIGTARAVARLYGCLAIGGALEDVRIVSADAIELGQTPALRPARAARRRRRGLRGRLSPPHLRRGVRTRRARVRPHGRGRLGSRRLARARHRLLVRDEPHEQRCERRARRRAPRRARDERRAVTSTAGRRLLGGVAELASALDLPER